VSHDRRRSGNAKPIRDRAGIADIVARAAGSLASGCSAVVIELQGYADHFGAAGRRQSCDYRAVDPAGHRNHDSRHAPVSGKSKKSCGIARAKRQPRNGGRGIAGTGGSMVWDRSTLHSGAIMPFLPEGQGKKSPVQVLSDLVKT